MRTAVNSRDKTLNFQRTNGKECVKFLTCTWSKHTNCHFQTISHIWWQSKVCFLMKWLPNGGEDVRVYFCFQYLHWGCKMEQNMWECKVFFSNICLRNICKISKEPLTRTFWWRGCQMEEKMWACQQESDWLPRPLPTPFFPIDHQTGWKRCPIFAKHLKYFQIFEKSLAGVGLIA